MSAFERWRLAARAQLNGLMERVAQGEDGRARAALVEDARGVVREALRASRTHVASLVSQIAGLRHDADRVENAAMAALKLGDEAAARDRLAEKLRLDRDRAQLESELTAARDEVSRLEGDLSAFEERLGGGDADGRTYDDALAALKRKLDE